jgi:hypothetical protein
LHSTTVDLADTFGQQMRYVRSRLGQVLTEVDAEGCHLARQPLVTALDRQTFQTLFMTPQSALNKVEKID